ncbi:hypothetical protein AVEN_152057-1 [Araneus ventricosus]|uniref:Uncharacterized protein n=1 Tax=Araneus ventricosus TaxID=182803 RepID=A0A4Y2NA18_ARAVE|nr:hypothetical protein AVEN_152057-1 [Araneus ventricosus]
MKRKGRERRPIEIGECPRVFRISFATENADEKSARVQGAVGLHFSLGSPAADGVGKRQWQSRQPAGILSLSVCVQASTIPFIPLKECCSPNLCWSTQIGVCLKVALSWISFFSNPFGGLLKGPFHFQVIKLGGLFKGRTVLTANLSPTDNPIP